MAAVPRKDTVGVVYWYINAAPPVLVSEVHKMMAVSARASRLVSERGTEPHTPDVALPCESRSDKGTKTTDDTFVVPRKLPPGCNTASV